jgi:DNA-binding MarR family transcriptional regulator
MAKNNDAGKHQFYKKWSIDIDQYNFTQVPNILLSCQGHLKLTDGEILTLIHLLTFWFSNESRVYPTITTLRKFSHKSYPTIQKRLRRLEEKGFVKRKHRLGTSNTYDLTMCVKMLQEHIKQCPSEHRKQSYYYLLNYESPPSITINKEYEAKRADRSKTENVKGEAENDSILRQF